MSGVQGEHVGTRPPCCSFASIDTENIHLATLKHAEDGNGPVLRGAAYGKKAKTANLRILDKEQKINVAHHEIFTLRIQDDCIKPVDILEA